ncbi:MAG TPA: hypothetical protein VGP72_21720 [Planctomycetota bacterium]|jgi:hypothetical protein
MAIVEEPKDVRSSWFVHIDMTSIVVIVVIGIVAFVAKSEYEKAYRNEVIAAQKVREEREKKEKEQAEELERIQAARREEERVRAEEAKTTAAVAAADAEKRRQLAKDADEQRRKKAQEEYQKTIAERQVQEAELIRKRKAETEGDKAKIVAATRVSYEAADKEVKDLETRLAAMPKSGPATAPEVNTPEATALRNKIAGAEKTMESLRYQINVLLGSHDSNARSEAKEARKEKRPFTRASFGGLTPNEQEVANQLNNKMEAAEKEAAEGRQRLSVLTRKPDEDPSLEIQRNNLLAQIAIAKQKRDGYAEELRQRGEPLVKVADNTKSTADSKTPESKAAQKTASSEPSDAPKTVYTLKDGKRIVAVKTVDAGDVVTVKTEEGKFMTIEKNDIEKTEKR